MKEKIIQAPLPMQLRMRRYKPSDLFKALVGRLDKTLGVMSFGSEKRPRWKTNNFVENDQFILFKFSTDIDGDKLLPTIADLLATYPVEKPDKLMIFPIAEKLFDRKHWVTVVFDPQTLDACLIDSRPTYISFFYPSGTIQAMLGANTLTNVYQAVQHNDIYCGTWTAANISKIIELELKNISAITDVMGNIFSSNQEESFYLDYPTRREIAFIKNHVSSTTNHLSQKSNYGFFSMLTDFFSSESGDAHPEQETKLSL